MGQLRASDAMGAVVSGRRKSFHKGASRVLAALSTVSIWPYLWLAVLYVCALLAFRASGI